MNQPQNVLQNADRLFVSALAAGQPIAGWLDEDLVWVDFQGHVFDKRRMIAPRHTSPLGDEAGLTPTLHDYGDVVTVAVECDKVFVLRIWAKHANDWRLLVWHEVSQNLPHAPAGPGRKDWDNPCRTIPYAPKTADERDVIASWQALETAVMEHDAEKWARHVADEFVVVGAARRHRKADRKAVLEEQKRTNANSAPSPLVSAQLFGFKDVMVMTCQHQPFTGKAAQVSRVFVKRGGAWLMAVSYQTTEQNAAVKSI